MKFRFNLFALICFFVLYAPLYPAENTPRVEAVVDWSKNTIYIKATWNLSNALASSPNAELRSQLRSAMLAKLSAVAAGLWAKANSSLENDLKGEVPDLSEYWAMLKLATFQVAENRVSATMDVTLRGKESLMANLPMQFGTEVWQTDEPMPGQGAYERRSGLNEYDASAGEPLLYSGLVIDARHLDFNPSINTNIFSSSGRQIYGAPFLSRSTAVKRGVTGFFAHEGSSDLRQRAGKRPLKISALDLMSRGENSLVISDEDAAKLLAHAGSIQNLRRARVVILITPGKVREKF